MNDSCVQFKGSYEKALAEKFKVKIALKNGEPSEALKSYFFIFLF